MKLTLGGFFGAVLGAFALVAGTTLAWTQDFPTRPVRFIVASGPGSTVDLYVRTLATQLEKQMGQPFVIENIVGAGTILGARALVQAAPDGYTIGWATNSVMVHSLVNKDVTFKWPDDIVLVHRGVSALVGLIVNKNVPGKTIDEFLAYAKANPGKLKATNSGPLSQAQVSSVQFQNAAGVKFLDVPYKSAVMMAQGLMTGEVDLAVTVPAVAEPALQTGDARMLAVATEERTPLLPGVPTMKESGIQMVYGIWQGFIVPKGTPEPIVDRYYREIAAALQTPELKKLALMQKTTPETGTREEMVEKVNKEVAEFKDLIKFLPLQP